MQIFLFYNYIVYKYMYHMTKNKPIYHVED